MWKSLWINADSDSCVVCILACTEYPHEQGSVVINISVQKTTLHSTRQVTKKSI
jgi:hypothetical protein